MTSNGKAGKVTIRTGMLAEIRALMEALPEFSEPLHTEEDLRKRLENATHLIQVAEVDGLPAGFKVGYARGDGFYSWLGGVLPAFRRLGIAAKLADEQEKWAMEQGFAVVDFKTRNRHKGMLVFALQRGFSIVGFEEKADIAEHRILLRKNLIPKQN